MEPGILSGFENTLFENPTRFEALKAEPTRVADRHPSPSCGLLAGYGAGTQRSI